jgi:hypothetical protein
VVPLKVTMMLADAAHEANGKLYILGGGWSISAPRPHAYAIALVLHGPWDQANVRHSARLELMDSDGEPVHSFGQDAKPVVWNGGFETGRPPGLKPGASLDAAVALPIPPHPISPGGRYEWRLWIDGETRDEWRLPFSAAAEGQQLRAA